MPPQSGWTLDWHTINSGFPYIKITSSTGHTFGSLNYATMHKVLLIVIFMLSVMSSNAQDTIPPQVPKSKKRKMPKKEMLLVNLNFDSWVGHPSYVSPQWGRIPWR
jgi:hypothetical protein